MLGLQNPYAPCDIGFQLSFCAVLGVQASVALTRWEKAHIPGQDAAGWQAQLRRAGLAVLSTVQTAALIASQYSRLMPAMLFAYAGMVLLILASAFAVATGKTVLPRRMAAVHMLVFQLVFMLIPDIRQALGAVVSTWDFVLSQGSSNAALCIWMLENAVWASRRT